MTLRIEDLISFVSKVLYVVVKNKISIDKAFQRVKSRWRDLESFKVYYDVTESVLRQYYKLKYLAKLCLGSESNKSVVKMWMMTCGANYFARKDVVERYVSRLRKRMRRDVDVSAAIEALRGDPIRYLAVKHSYPEPFVRELSKVFAMDDLERLLEAMNRETIWLRVNTLKIDVYKAIRLLESQGVEVSQDKDIPFALKVVRSRRPVHHVECVKSCQVIVQDKASMLAVLALDPRPGDVIYDVCAAPGVKTSLVMQLTENRARVVAVDVSRSRLENMRRLMKRYGVDESKIDIVLADSRHIKLKRMPDKVLVDAPCSSSGAISRDPAIKISLERIERISWYVGVQREILKNMIEQLRGCMIVYSVCSILPQEGEEVIEDVVRAYGCAIEKPLPNVLSDGYSKYSVAQKVGRTFPHVHDCEGFLISRIYVS